MKIPMIDIRTQHARIGIERVPGKLEVRTFPPEVHTKQRPAQMEFHDPPADLRIDSSRAWNAIYGGKLLDFTRRITEQIPEILLQRMADMVERGNRMAAIHIPPNPIPDIALEGSMNTGTGLDVFGPASYDNVDIEFIAHDFDMDVQIGGVDIDVTIRKPETSFQRGRLHIYMEQYPTVEIIPPKIDLRI